MSVTTQLSTNDHLVSILSRIKSINTNLVDIDIDVESIQQNEEINNMFNCKYYDDYQLIIIYKNDTCLKLKNSDVMQNDSGINMGSNFIILNNQGEQIVSFFNKKKYDQDAINELKLLVEDDWKSIEINKLQLHVKHVCLFNYKDIWYVAYSNVIERFIYGQHCLNDEPTNFVKSKVVSILSDYLSSKFVDLNACDKNLSYHLLIRDNEFKKNNLGSIMKSIETNVNLLWICDKSCKLINLSNSSENEIVNKIQQEKKIHFSCLDEMLMSTELMNNEDIITKNIQYGGYLIKMFDKVNNVYKLYCIRTDIYKYITSILPKYDNQYKSFLELYQNDKLTEVLPYLHKYPADVIRRINMSVKILSKEILNIYHLTRKKQNKELYESLPLSYRKTLYDLHKIYVNQKYGEFISKSHDLLKEKKSVSVDIVYSYLKSIKNNELIKLFDDRRKLIEELHRIGFKYDEIISINNIDIITQTELMFSN